jgi:hypothetical protein
MNARTALTAATVTLALVIPTAAGAGTLRTPHHATTTKQAVSHQTSKQRQAIAKAKAAKLRAAKARAAKAQRAGRPLLIWIAPSSGPSSTNESLDPCETYGVDCPEVSSTNTPEVAQVETSSDDQISAPAPAESQTSDESSIDTSATASSNDESSSDAQSVDSTDDC